MIHCESSAKQTAQNALDGTDRAIQDGDFTAFSSFFDLPLVTEINGKTEVISTIQGLETVFDRFQKHLKLNRVTMIHRRIILAEFVRSDLAHTTHETHLVAGHLLINEPYPVYSELQLAEGRWHIISSKTAFPDTSRLGSNLLEDLC